jgi:Flp pilus assembly protein TadG
MKVRAPSFFRDSRATAAAEMALMLPVLVALIFSTFEAGYFLWSEHKVVKGVRDGARYAARQDFNDFTCSSNTIDPTVVDDIKNLTRTGTADGTGNDAVPGWTNADITVTLSCDDTTQTGIYATLGTAPRVKVSATVAYPSLFGMLGFNTGGIHLNASAQSAVMGL